MKPHHRASLLLGCLGLFFLYLPAGLRVAGSWPLRPGLATVPARAVGLDLVSGRAASALLPRPQGPTPPPADGALERVQDLYAGGQ